MTSLHGHLRRAGRVILANVAAFVPTVRVLMLKFRYRPEAAGFRIGYERVRRAEAERAGPLTSVDPIVMTAGTLISKLESPPSSNRSFPTL